MHRSRLRAGIRLHDLRHTHVTLVSITLDTYSHILPGFEQRVVESIGAALFS